jgi:FkbM family methyltransferase
MLKSIARTLLPAGIRRWFQRRKLDRQVAGFSRRIVEHRYGDSVLRVELADPLAAGWYDHDWDALPEVVLLGRHGLRPGARVFDLGAHQGVVGLMLGRCVGPDGCVLLVEPNAHNAAMCVRNAELNGMPWVSQLRAAVADREGMLRFNGGLNGQAAELSDYGGVTEVPAVTVDGLADRYGHPDVVFLDVEGFECRALAGAARTLARTTDWAVEVHVGCGLEATGASVEQVLGHFSNDAFIRHVHQEGAAAAVRLEDAGPELLCRRFFLTAVARRRCQT